VELMLLANGHKARILMVSAHPVFSVFPPPGANFAMKPHFPRFSKGIMKQLAPVEEANGGFGK
jgi:hypothetical protein